MTWTYDPTALGTTSTGAALAQVRFLVGDIDATNQLVQDEEIRWLLSQHNNLYESAAMTARAIATHFSKLAASKSVGSLSLSYERRSDFFMSLYESLLASAASPAVRSFQPYAGGVSKLDKALNASDPDWDKPSFARGAHDIPSHPPDWISPPSIQGL